MTISEKWKVIAGLPLTEKPSLNEALSARDCVKQYGDLVGVLKHVKPETVEALNNATKTRLANAILVVVNILMKA